MPRDDIVLTYGDACLRRSDVALLEDGCWVRHARAGHRSGSQRPASHVTCAELEDLSTHAQINDAVLAFILEVVAAGVSSAHQALTAFLNPALVHLSRLVRTCKP